MLLAMSSARSGLVSASACATPASACAFDSSLAMLPATRSASAASRMARSESSGADARATPASAQRLLVPVRDAPHRVLCPVRVCGRQRLRDTRERLRFHRSVGDALGTVSSARSGSAGACASTILASVCAFCCPCVMLCAVRSARTLSGWSVGSGSVGPASPGDVEASASALLVCVGDALCGAFGPVRVGESQRLRDPGQGMSPLVAAGDALRGVLGPVGVGGSQCQHDPGQRLRLLLFVQDGLRGVLGLIPQAAGPFVSRWGASICAISASACAFMDASVMLSAQCLHGPVRVYDSQRLRDTGQRMGLPVSVGDALRGALARSASMTASACAMPSSASALRGSSWMVRASRSAALKAAAARCRTCPRATRRAVIQAASPLGWRLSLGSVAASSAVGT